MTYDVAIIGAGPCGLAVAARLRELTPSALFTDNEHARYWRRFNCRHTIENELRRKVSVDSGHNSLEDYQDKSEQAGLSMAVLDATSEEWLAKWKDRFSKLEISHLRSPLFFHPDPRDRDGLLAYAYENGRDQELLEIENIVGKEHSKHHQKRQRSRRPSKKIAKHLQVDGRDRTDYFTPSTNLFSDYCMNVIKRYGLQKVVQKTRVHSVKYGDVDSRTEGQLFTIDTSSGIYLSKSIVLAIGLGTSLSVPRDCNLMSPIKGQGSVSHCFMSNGVAIPDFIRRKIDAKEETNIVVIGGGLSSAQVVDILVHQGITKVWLLIRSKYKVKHFDVDLEWVSKCRNQQMATFWTADTDEERLDMLRKAKSGGSVTPRFDKILQRHVAAGKLSIHTHTELENWEWRAESETWLLETNPSISNLPNVDHVIFATGAGSPDVRSISCLQHLFEDDPIQTVGGLPVINEDLMWNDQIPVFFTGALAALRLGPGAANLAGARQGAERIAWKLEQLLSRRTEGESSEMYREHSQRHTLQAQQLKDTTFGASTPSLEDRKVFTGDFSNRFDILSITGNGYGC